MKALILGIGDAFTRHAFGSSALIEHDGRYVLLDCPDLVHRALHAATAKAGWQVDSDGIHDVLLTHLHGDHSNGLESFALRRMIERFDRDLPLPTLHTNAPVAARVWDKLAPALDAVSAFSHAAKLDDFFALRVLEPERRFEVAGLEIECRFTRHPVPTTGFLIRAPDWTLGWSGDTAFEPAHVAWLAQADRIVHETNDGPAHTPLADLEALPEDVRRKLHLIHVPDAFDPTATRLPVLYEGQVLEG